jgi:hypothetical protein
MAGDLDFGDLPTWLTAASPAAVAVLEGRRRNRVAELGRKIEGLVVAIEDLADRTLESEELEELVNRAVEDAARTTWQEKLDALASVVAAAMEGDDTVVSSSLLVEAALSRLERPHALALSHIAEVGPITPQQLAERWPGSTMVVDPLLSVLAGEGLIRNIASGTYDGLEGREKWVLSELGEELLFLLDPDNPHAAASGAIAVHLEGSMLALTNKGKAVLRLYAATIAGDSATSTLIPTEERPEALPLAPGEHVQARFLLIPSGPAVVSVVWMDRRGRHTSTFNVNVG